MFGETAGIFLPSAEWRVQGVDPVEVGFRPGHELMTGEEVLVLHNVAIDISDWHEVRIVRMPPDGAMVRSDRVQPVVEAVFPDAHPSEWVDALAADEIGVVVVGDRPPAVYGTFDAWLAEALVAPVQVLRWIANEGAGPTLTGAPTEGVEPELEVRQQDRDLARRWFREGYLGGSPATFDEVAALDAQGRAALLGALVEDWGRAAESAATNGAFSTVEDASVASLDATRQAALDADVHDDLLNECASVAAAQARGDWQSVGSACTATASSSGAKIVTMASYFMRAQWVALAAEAAARGLTVKELLDEGRA